MPGAIPARRLSLANSAGIALGAEYSFDLTRPGLALYGGVPRGEAAGGIRPVVAVEARQWQMELSRPARLVQLGWSVSGDAIIGKP